MNKQNLKRLISHVFPAKANNRKLILLYHSLGTSPWALSTDMFKQQMQWLADHCRVLSLTELMQADNSTELQVAITFDDGYASLHDQAAVITADKKIQPTVYLNTGWIGQQDTERKLSDPSLGHYPNERFMTWPEVKNLHQAGWEVGSHGVNHHNFAEMSEIAAQQELTISKADIEQQLHQQCLHFAYPWGRYTDNVKNIVKSVGYKYAASARHGEIKQHSDLLAFPRINIAREYSFADFKSILQGKWNFLGWIQRMRGL